MSKNRSSYNGGRSNRSGGKSKGGKQSLPKRLKQHAFEQGIVYKAKNKGGTVIGDAYAKGAAYVGGDEKKKPLF
ncbi:hypothetical protein FACS1894211_02510 [Clostridia bacterium]|nr:hypothetical protein FACS1894211_02510 [Clostridia bacterium]